MPTSDVLSNNNNGTPESLINDPLLLSTLHTVSSARTAALHLFDLTNPSLPSEDPDPTSSPSLTQSRSQKHLLSHLSLLRSHNRRLAHLCRATKAHTSTSRAEVDTLHLSLQNLHYESRHLAGEIGACERWPHTYVQLPLVSEEEFLRETGREEWARRVGRRRQGVLDDGDGAVEAEQEKSLDVEISGITEEAMSAVVGQQENKDIGVANTNTNDSITDWSDEALMRARIEAEMEERTRLEEVRKGLVARKMELVRENAKRKEELGKLDKELEVWIEAAKPIQKTFEKEW